MSKLVEVNKTLQELGEKKERRGCRDKEFLRKIGMQPKWQNQPTTNIRIPQVFGEDLKLIARAMDNGDPEVFAFIEKLKSKIESEDTT